MIFKILALAAASIWLAVLALPDGKLHLVFCDVGQGDAILVSLGTNQMLVDGGPNKSVLECLARHMPFYDHRIEVVVLTHPQADHMTGLGEVFKRYTVLEFVRSDVENAWGGRVVRTGDEIQISNLKFQIIWPEAGFTSKELNDYSVVGKLTYGDFDVLLTGDAGADVVPPVPAEILKVPHHGSKFGMTADWLARVSPYAAVISAGKRNSYGHPAPETLKLLRDEDIKILRTDLPAQAGQSGDVEIVSDGRKYWVKK